MTESLLKKNKNVVIRFNDMDCIPVLRVKGYDLLLLYNRGVIWSVIRENKTDTIQFLHVHKGEGLVVDIDDCPKVAKETAIALTHTDDKIFKGVSSKLLHNIYLITKMLVEEIAYIYVVEMHKDYEKWLKGALGRI